MNMIPAFEETVRNLDTAESSDRPTVLRERMNSASLAHPIKIETADIDFMGHVNNATYLTWVQNAVIAHWERFAGSDAIAAHRWVALKHEITYRKAAYLDDQLVATTVLERVRRESAFYDTVISRGKDVLAHVKSRWCCLDAVTLRPIRLADDIVKRFLPPKTAA